MPVDRHAPTVVELARLIKSLWIDKRRKMTGSDAYQPHPKHHKTWVEAAIKVIDEGLVDQVDAFIEAQIVSIPGRKYGSPALLTGKKALERYHEFVQNVLPVRRDHFRAQIRFAQQLIDRGKSIEHICDGGYDFTDFVLWLLCVTHGMKERAEEYRESAMSEWDLQRDAITDVVGEKLLKELGVLS